MSDTANPTASAQPDPDALLRQARDGYNSATAKLVELRKRKDEISAEIKTQLANQAKWRSLLPVQRKSKGTS